MSARHPTPTAALRGGSVGALTAALAIAAHGIAGGGFPDSAALTLLLAACAAVGAATGGLPGSANNCRTLLGALAAGQAAGHLALTATNDPHVHAGLPAAAMLAAHAAATVVCAALVLVAERLYLPITRVLRTVLRSPVLGVESTPVPRPGPLDRPEPRIAVLAAGISRRGPPVHA
ncbi:hypothetical protein ERC79_12195 [Rhodococcus sp. ABRD24]|uniref:hypothetical protein n=1 Tax=Rhodococcus sp. ABRD24 TaxID=2507582 RepID=UPI001039255F|nr:hypothetical protein [Rhodococcus sp. ABRD24]QBJ96644.1 hypothetical protein ERC79_12195 [Rhodococcus sp. ABRD24]